MIRKNVTVNFILLRIFRGVIIVTDPIHSIFITVKQWDVCFNLLQDDPHPVSDLVFVQYISREAFYWTHHDEVTQYLLGFMDDVFLLCLLRNIRLRLSRITIHDKECLGLVQTHKGADLGMNLSGLVCLDQHYSFWCMFYIKSNHILWFPKSDYASPWCKEPARHVI